MSMYSNCYQFDTDKKEWSEIEIPQLTPRWNHCSVLVKALPEYKIFIFGGSTGYFEEGTARNFGTLTESIIYMNIKDEIKKSRWLTVSPEDQKLQPSPRENSTLVYDEDDNK